MKAGPQRPKAGSWQLAAGGWWLVSGAATGAQKSVLSVEFEFHRFAIREIITCGRALHKNTTRNTCNLMCGGVPIIMWPVTGGCARAGCHLLAPGNRRQAADGWWLVAGGWRLVTEAPSLLAGLFQGAASWGCPAIKCHSQPQPLANHGGKEPCVGLPGSRLQTA